MGKVTAVNATAIKAAAVKAAVATRATAISQGLRRVDRRWWWSAGALALVLVVVAAWWVSRPDEPRPRARQYLEYTACLLVDDGGVAGPEAAPVWAGLQDASLATHAKVQYLSVAGPQTVDNAVPFVASLAQGHCDQVYAAGPVPVAAVERSASTFPAVRFFVVGAGALDGKPAPNVEIVPEGSAAQVSAAVADRLTSGLAAVSN